MSGPQSKRPAAGLERLGDLIGGTWESLPAERAEGTSGGHKGGGATARGPGAIAGEAVDLAPARALAYVWPDVVGAEVAANARPVQLKQGRLVVAASSSAWAQTLQFMGANIMAGINGRLGSEVVNRVVFRHAGWEERPSADPGPWAETTSAPERCAPAGGRPSPEALDVAPAAPESALSPDQKAALAEVEGLDLPPALRERMVRAMTAAFVRGEKDFVRSERTPESRETHSCDIM